MSFCSLGSLVSSFGKLVSYYHHKFIFWQPESGAVFGGSVRGASDDADGRILGKRQVCRAFSFRLLRLV
jgi:hypothetical protein